MKRMLLISRGTVPPGGFRYRQAETGALISAGSWPALKNAVAHHRRVNKLPIGTDFEAELQDWICRAITDAGMHCHEEGRMAQRTYPASGAGTGNGYDGRAKWRELHLYALTERHDPLTRAAWLANFAASLPCGECKQGWKKLCRQNPLSPKAGDEEFFRWTVDRHNDVNRKLGKPILTYEQALALYA